MGFNRDTHTLGKSYCLDIDRRVLPGLMLTVVGLVRDRQLFSSRSYSDSRRRVFRRAGERYADCCVVEVNHFGGGDYQGLGRNK